MKRLRLIWLWLISDEAVRTNKGLEFRSCGFNHDKLIIPFVVMLILTVLVAWFVGVPIYKYITELFK